MRKFILLPIFATVILHANSNTFSNDNPYQSLSTIEEKQIVGENFVEVYESQNNVENSSFDFFGLLENDEPNDVNQECEIDPLTGECPPTNVPFPVPINKYQFILVLIGMGLIFKRKFY